MKAYFYSTDFSCGECGAILTAEGSRQDLGPLPVFHPMNDFCPNAGKLFKQPTFELTQLTEEVKP